MPDLLEGLVSGPMAVRTSEGVAQVIRKGILSGLLLPGQELPERKLAEELGVSRTPVREALFILQGEGLVELIPGRCARVREMLHNEIQQIYSLRRVLEAHAARGAAEQQDEAKIASVAEMLAAQRRVGASASATEQAQADLAFHEAIAAAAGSQLLLTLMRQVLAVTATYRSALKYSGARVKNVNAQHSAILKAIRKGDGDAAEALMSKHIQESTKIALKYLSRTDGTQGPYQDVDISDED